MVDPMIQFTDDDVAVGPVLGPEYRASNRLAEAILAKFEAEHLKPLVEKVADEFRDKLWDDVRDYLLQDTELNVGGAIRDMVSQTIEALLTGKEWAMQRYPYADYSRGEEIRKAVAKHAGDNILSLRIVELETDLAKRDETIRNMRESRW